MIEEQSAGIKKLADENSALKDSLRKSEDEVKRNVKQI
jgi:hypothetical protein